MKTKLKKYNALLVVAVMLFALIPFAVSAAGSGSGDGYTEKILAANEVYDIYTAGSNGAKLLVSNTGSDVRLQEGELRCTLDAYASASVDGKIFTAREQVTRLVFAVDENVTGAGNKAPFIVVLEGKLDAVIEAGDSFDVAYQNDDRSGYINAKTVTAVDVSVSIYLTGTSLYDSVSFNSGTVMINGVSYQFESSGTGLSSLTVDFDKDSSIYSTGGDGTLTVSASEPYTDFLHGYDFVDDGSGTYKATFLKRSFCLPGLTGGTISLDEGDLVEVNGTQVESLGTARVTVEQDGRASVVGSAAITKEGSTAALTVDGDPDDSEITAHVDQNGVFSATTKGGNSVALGTDGECTLSLTEVDGTVYEHLLHQGGKLSVTMKKGSKLLYEVPDLLAIFTATENVAVEWEVNSEKPGNDAIEMRILAHPHAWGPWSKLDANTHTRTCTVAACGKTETAAHEWARGATITSPTHMQGGTRRSTCRACGTSKTIRVPKLSQHTFADTWSSDEENHWRDCECGEKSDVASHTFAEIVTSATLFAAGDCEKDTLYYRSCSTCGKLSGETFVGAKAVGHSFTKYTSDNNATCEADGTKTAKCDRCDKTETVTDTGSMLDHTFSAYVSDGNATCEADGTKTAQCSGCGKKDTVADAGSMLAHTFKKGACTDCAAEDPDYVSLSWLPVSIGAFAVVGGGFAAYWLWIRKKK